MRLTPDSHPGRCNAILADVEAVMSQRIPTPRERIQTGRRPGRRTSAFLRQTFTLPRAEARLEARAYLDRFPATAYMTRVESWRELDDGRIEFTMMRLPTAD